MIIDEEDRGQDSYFQTYAAMAEIIRGAVEKERECCARMFESYNKWVTPAEAAAMIRSRNK